MATKLKAGCARPTGGPVRETVSESIDETNKSENTLEVRQMITVGSKAPDFTAPGYHKGDFVDIKLSDYLGKWLILCFYPGDFTFV